jgi:ATP-dependent Clp protease ATP-binding subunit ClpB
VFHPLGREQIRSIANIQIEHLRKRLQEKDITLEVSDAALDKLGEAGFDPVYGARPLKRAIQQRLENPLAQQLLTGEFIAGDTISIDVRDDEITFGKLQAVKAAV